MNFIYNKEQNNSSSKTQERDPQFSPLFNDFIAFSLENYPTDFIKEKKYEKELLEKHNIKLGFCDDNVYHKLREKGYSVEILKKAGFVIDKYTTKYKDCIIFVYNSYYFKARPNYKSKKGETIHYFPEESVAGSKPPYKLQGTKNQLILAEGETDSIALKHLFPEHNIMGVGGVQSSVRYVKEISKDIEKVYICYDNDKTGQAYQKKMCDALFERNIDCEMICFPEEYKDIDELFRNKGNEALEYLKYKLNPKLEELNDMNGFTAQWLLDNDIPETQWLIDNFLVKGGITVFGGDSGAGKSLLGLYLSMCIANQKPLFDIFPNQKSDVLYLDEENIPSTIKTRLKALSKTCEISENLDSLNFYVMENIKLDSQQGKNKDGLEKFNHLMKKHKPKICIIDSLVRFFCGDENSSNDVKEIFETLKLAAKNYGTSFILLHHTTKMVKGGSRKHTLRGSGDISAMADIVFVLSKVSNTNLVSIHQEKNRHEQPIQPFNMLINEVYGDLCVSYGGELESGKKSTAVDTAVNEIIDMVKKNNWLEIYTTVAKPAFLRKGFTERNWSSALTQMQNQGWISKIEGTKGKYKVKDDFREVCEYE